MDKIELPTEYQVSSYLAQIMRAEYVMPEEGHDNEEDTCIDVRLAVKESGQWHIFVGCSDYDSWHGAVCGASCFNTSTIPTTDSAIAIARDLLSQCEEQCHA